MNYCSEEYILLPWLAGSGPWNADSSTGMRMDFPIPLMAYDPSSSEFIEGTMIYQAFQNLEDIGSNEPFGTAVKKQAPWCSTVPAGLAYREVPPVVMKSPSYESSVPGEQMNYEKLPTEKIDLADSSAVAYSSTKAAAASAKASSNSPVNSNGEKRAPHTMEEPNRSTNCIQSMQNDSTSRESSSEDYSHLKGLASRPRKFQPRRRFMSAAAPGDVKEDMSDHHKINLTRPQGASYVNPVARTGRSPSFSLNMKRTNVLTCFFLSIPTEFCKEHLPCHDLWVTLEDEKGNTWKAKYLARRHGLSAGWRRLALERGIALGETITFSMITQDHFQFRTSYT